MPIRIENRFRYPKDWPEISRRIRFERAGGRCECSGQCGKGHDAIEDAGRCHWRHGELLPSGRPIILTTMHLNHDPGDCRDENLLAGCQGCHLRYDMRQHRETRTGQKEMWK